MKSCLALLGSLFLIIGCSSSGPPESEDGNEATGALQENQTAASPELIVTCQVLQETRECGDVTICKVSTQGRCAATPASLASDPLWGDMCTRHGPNRDACQRNLGNFCEWQETESCVPNAGANVGAAVAQGDKLDIACKVLGEARQCDKASVCKASRQASCKALDAAAASDPRWKDMCPRAGVNEQACGWQSMFCKWEQVEHCVPSGR